MQYRLLKSDKKSLMSDERIPQLEKLGFKWNSDSQLTLTIAWNEQLSEIMEFKQRWGNCDIPQNYTKNKILGCWVSNKRRKYKLSKIRKMSFISDERTLKLEKLGFQWETKYPIQEKL